MRGAELNLDGNIEVNSSMRAVTGNCAHCGGIVVVLNFEFGWPLARCRCGWSAPTDELLNHSYLERVKTDGQASHGN